MKFSTMNKQIQHEFFMQKLSEPMHLWSLDLLTTGVIILFSIPPIPIISVPYKFLLIRMVSASVATKR